MTQEAIYRIDDLGGERVADMHKVGGQNRQAKIEPGGKVGQDQPVPGDSEHSYIH